MRNWYIRCKLQIKFYRDYKSLNPEYFNNEISELTKPEKSIFVQVLNAQATFKKKVQIIKNNPFMTKQMHKAIRHHSRLKTIFNKIYFSQICYKNMIYNYAIQYHGVIILNRSDNSQISIETSGPQQAGGFIIKYYFGISNITVCR